MERMILFSVENAMNMCVLDVTRSSRVNILISKEKNIMKIVSHAPNVDPFSIPKISMNSLENPIAKGIILP